MAIFAKIDFRGLKYPPEVLVQLKTCSAICGTHVHTILNHKIWLGRQRGSGKVKIRSNKGQYGVNFGPYVDLPWPPLSTRSNLCGSKCYVPHIVLHVLSSTSTWGGYFRPQKSILANCYFWLFLRTFPHSRYGPFQCLKRKSKTTFHSNIPPISGKYGLRTHS